MICELSLSLFFLSHLYTPPPPPLLAPSGAERAVGLGCEEARVARQISKPEERGSLLLIAGSMQA